MKWGARVWVFACAALIGCAGSDGGPVGTGISTSSASISGNVIDVQTTSAASVAADAATLPSITVSIDGTNARTSADADGNFELSGDFSGSVTVRFTVPQFQVTQALDVPAGSAIVLQDVELSSDGVQAQAARQLDFNGRVALVDCTDGTLLVDDNRDPDMQLTVQLLADTTVTRGNGDSVSCADIAGGDAVEIEGYIQLQPAPTGRVIAALTVVLAPPLPSEQPPPVQDVAFAGDVAALNCDAGFVVIDDSLHRSRVHLSGATVITGTDSGLIGCPDLALGEHVAGRGQITLADPGLIEASSLLATASAVSDTLRVFGFVSYIDCAAGLLLLNDPSTTTPVQVLAGTVIVLNDNTPLQCADIDLGDRVSGAGQISTSTPGAIDAAMLVLSRGTTLR